MITIGIDPHKRSLTAVALDPHSRVLGQQRLAVTSQVATQLLAWAEQWPRRRWAVEGASGLGRGIAQLLVAAEEQVLDVPAKLSARARLLSTSSARKTDLADACSVAAAALHHRRLRPVALEDQTVIFRLLSDRRDDLVAERTRTLSRLHVLLSDLQPGGANRELTATRAAALLRRAHPITIVDVERKRIAHQLLADVRRLDRQVKTASQAIRTAVGEHGTTLTQVYGVGPVLAAKLLGHSGDITRFPDRDHFASYTGTAPVEASSGDVRRHRLNRAGNRQLNTALHLIAVCQIRDPSPGRPTTGANSARPRRLRRPAGASNDISPTSSTATWSSITATAGGAVDTQRRYRVMSPDRWVPSRTSGSWPTDQDQGTKPVRLRSDQPPRAPSRIIAGRHFPHPQGRVLVCKRLWSRWAVDGICSSACARACRPAAGKARDIHASSGHPGRHLRVCAG